MGVYVPSSWQYIVSPDKDMRQILELCNFEETFTITPEEGAK